MFGVCCLLVVVFGVFRLLFVVRWLALVDDCCLLLVNACLLLIVSCLLFVVVC